MSGTVFFFVPKTLKIYYNANMLHKAVSVLHTTIFATRINITPFDINKNTVSLN